MVVAAGASRRMGGDDKLRLQLAGRPVLRWSVEAMRAAASVDRILVVAAPDRLDGLASEAWTRDAGCTLVPGGARRQDSVRAGVEAASADVVLVHDGARPFVPASLVDAVAATADEHGAAVPVLPVADALKSLDEAGGLRATPRDGLLRAQTPQGARRELLLAAFAARGGEEHVDEASLLEAHGIPVRGVPGDPANLKLTDPTDLELARAIADARGGAVRWTSATDSHPFGPQRGLAVGGLLIEEAPRLAGHSDGDVVLHAVADALLAGAGLPDLGRAFPAGDAATRGIDSARILADVSARVRDAGVEVVSVDVSILGSRPRLGGARLDAMRERVAGLLGLSIERVSIKASTGNLLGPEGSGLAITATALVGVRRS